MLKLHSAAQVRPCLCAKDRKERETGRRGRQESEGVAKEVRKEEEGKKERMRRQNTTNRIERVRERERKRERER